MTSAGRKRLARALSAELATLENDANETAILVPGIGCLFVSRVQGATVVEAVAINDGESRDVVLARHDALERRAREIFGDRLEPRDPLGLRGGERAVVS